MAEPLNNGSKIPLVRPWRNSLLLRMMVLCGILLLCLFGSVLIITQFYFNEAAEVLRAQAEETAGELAVKFEDNPELDLSDYQQELTGALSGANLELRPFETAAVSSGETAPVHPIPQGAAHSIQSSQVYFERQENGAMDRVVSMWLNFGGKDVLMTLRAPVSLPGELVRAFSNRYMIVLTLLFLITLGLMIYLIARTLRPLQELSESCAAISEGELLEVSTANSTNEIRSLEETFNRMVHSLREKEMMETKLRQAQRLSALGNLAAGVAHDIRNPLNAIKLLSSHALDSQPVDAPASRAMRTIRDEVARLEDIISSFLSLARESELTPEPVKADELLEDCVHLLRKDAEERQVQLTADYRAGNPALMLDPKQWNRAILNILLNALEACVPGGRVRLFSRVTDSHYEVEIRDDGPGMPQEKLELAFDPYYTTKPGGTGLGLSITRGIVEEHGGTIQITSSEGQGCQVLVSLPLRR
ncbi:MAG: HAMP domain-containing protein [Candidatus Hydrogenedentes bacterium]|nr:HAMP domain-containing protein [Candidatus Hydrogenedentota bacterium]